MPLPRIKPPTTRTGGRTDDAMELNEYDLQAAEAAKSAFIGLYTPQGFKAPYDKHREVPYPVASAFDKELKRRLDAMDDADLSRLYDHLTSLQDAMVGQDSGSAAAVPIEKKREWLYKNTVLMLPTEDM